MGKYKFNLLMVSLGLLGILVMMLFARNEAPLAKQTIENYRRQAYADEFFAKLQSTNFTSDVLDSMTEKGYNHNDSLGFIVTSPANQTIAVYLKNLEEVNGKVVKEIQGIVDITAKNNEFLPFAVDIQLLEDD